MNRIILGLAAAATVAVGLPAFTAAANAQPVNERAGTQQGRIEQGERSGALTPREAGHLENRESRLNDREARMRARDGGVLNGHQHRVLERQENRDSRAIYRKKHNARGY